MKKLDPSTWFWASLAVAVLIMGVRIELLHQLDITAAPPSGATLVPIASAAPPTIQAENQPAAPSPTRTTPSATKWLFVGPPLHPPMSMASAPDHYVILDTLKRGDSIYLSLKRNDISERQISLLNAALGKVFDANSKSRPKDCYQLTVDTSGVVRRFLYTPYSKPEEPLLVELHAGTLVGRLQQRPLETRAYITEVLLQDNLSNAIRAAGEGDGLTDKLTDRIFGSVIDFRVHPRKGDRINILFEKEYLDGRFIRYGRVLLADYKGQQVELTAVNYKDPSGHEGYYNLEGKSLERLFLLYPLSFRGITSHFNLMRFHPVLKRNIPHRGTDYAAVVGEKVYSTALGTVTHAGRKGSYGLLIEIEHPNGYRTRYAHLSRISVKKGQRVAQRANIGKVGATGRVTGPHLHYEIIKNGRHINPSSVNKGVRGKSLQKKYRSHFATHRDSLLDFFNSHLQRTALARSAGN